MSFTPLLNAELPIFIHAMAAIIAFTLGVVQLAGVKGTSIHRLIGWVWVLSMFVVAISSFWIHELKHFGQFSWIHLLSIFVLVQLPVAVYAARSGQVQRHRYGMMGLFFGGLIIAGIFTFLPGRIMYQVVFGG